MNTKRILSWGSFILIIVLIVWGLIAAAKKADKESSTIANVDQVTANDWVKGSTTSPVTLIEYSDFQCPACYAMFPVIERLTAEEAQKFRFVYRHFPLPQHTNAIPASQAAEAAGKQGKFWEMYQMIFVSHDEWENSTDIKNVFAGYAKKLGLDMTKYAVDVELKEITDKINTSVKSGLKAGVTWTPTFYLNGKKLMTNPSSYEEFKKLIETTYASSTASTTNP